MGDNMDMTAALLVAGVICTVAGWLAWHFWRAHRVRAVPEPWAARWHSCRDHRRNRGRSYSSSDRETDKAGFGVALRARASASVVVLFVVARQTGRSRPVQGKARQFNRSPHFDC